MPLDSNTSRPVPPADTGNALLDLIADGLLKATQLERRIDPFIRPAFDATLRDPIARLVTWLINLRREDEGLALAEGREDPDERIWLQSIIDTFTAQMKGLWRPGGFERGGNQSRTRKRMYWELSRLRHDMNQVPHYEPTGDETFD